MQQQVLAKSTISRFSSMLKGYFLIFPMLLPAFHSWYRKISFQSIHTTPVSTFPTETRAIFLEFIRLYLSPHTPQWPSLTIRIKHKFLAKAHMATHDLLLVYLSFQPDFVPFTALIQLYHYFLGFLQPFFPLFFNVCFNAIFSRNFFWNSIKVISVTLCTILPRVFYRTFCYQNCHVFICSSVAFT